MTGKTSMGPKMKDSLPALYRGMLTLSLMSLALGLNFWTSTPTFNPYDIPKNVIGGVFFTLGLWQLLSINIRYNVKWVKSGLNASLIFILFWGLTNMQQSVAGKASFQLPILYISLAIMHWPLKKRVTSVEEEATVEAS